MAGNVKNQLPLRKSPFMWVVYHELELSQISKIKEYIFLNGSTSSLQSKPGYLSVQTLKFWFSNMTFQLNPSERLLHERTEVTVLYSLNGY